MRLVSKNQLRIEFEDTAATASSLYLAFLDLNSLKIINDTYGHAVGDQVIQQVDTIISNSEALGSYSKIGGDEFVMLFADTLPSQVETAIDTIQSNLIHSSNLTVTVGGVSAAVGVVLHDPAQHADFDVLYQAADRLMYAAKKNPPSFRLVSWRKPRNKRQLNTNGARQRAYFEWATVSLSKEYPQTPYPQLLQATRKVFEKTETILDYSPKLLFSMILKELDSITRVNQ